MEAPVLFSTGASPTSSGSRNLVEFKAGKMEMRDKMVYPVKRPGLVYLRQSPDDNLMHFCWKDRQTGVTEDDLILFPGDCEFQRVKECTTGRVYTLYMKSSNKRMFFWMQEAKAEKDEVYCKKILEMLDNPPRPGSDMSQQLSEREMSSLFSSMTQEQVAQLLNSSGVNIASLLNATGRSPSSNSGASASSTASTTNSAQNSAAGNANAAAAAAAAASLVGGNNASPGLNELQALISGALMEGNEEEASALMAAATMAQAEASAASESSQQSMSSSSQQQQQAQPLIDLSTSVNSDSLAYLLNNEEFLRRIEPHLPSVSASDQSTMSPMTSDDRKKQFSDTVRSSQFRSSLSQFCVALQSGQLGPLMAQFGLNEACVAAASLGNLEAFVRALEAQMKSSGGNDTAQQPPGSGSNN